MLDEFTVRIIVVGLEEVIWHIIFVEYLWRNIFLMRPSKIRGLTIAGRLLSVPLWGAADLIALVEWPLDTKTLTFAYVAYRLLFLEK